MEVCWSLMELYASFGSKEFKTDLEKLDGMIEDINEWVKGINNFENKEVTYLEEYITKFSDFENLVSKLNTFIELNLSVNTKDKEGLKYSGILEKKLTLIVSASTKIEKWISKINRLEEIINKSKILKEHEFILKEIAEKSKYLLSDKEEIVISNMKNTGSRAWLKLKDSLISNLKVEINEDNEIKELPLTVVLNMAYSDNKETRRKGYEAEIKSYK